MFKGQYIEIGNFGGGIVNPQGNSTGDPSSYSTQIELNQASDLDNIVIYEGGRGFRTRGGSSVQNTTALNGPVTGLHYYLKSDGTDFAIAVAGTKLYRATDFSASYSDITGALSISSGSANLWDLFTFNDTVVGFGGPIGGPNAPFKCTDSGNGAALGGSPPSAYGAFAANNRIFAFRTAANPSTAFWSILSSAEDWTGVGSGSIVIGSTNDNTALTAGILVDRNTAYFFKENNIYQMVLTSAPFPIFLIASGVGVGGKGCVCNVDGVIYFLTTQLELKAIRGGEIVSFSKEISNLGRSITNFAKVRMFRHIGRDFDWLVINAGDQSSGRSFIWDLLNKCWLKSSTAYKSLTSVAIAINNQSLATVRYYYGDKDGYTFSLDNEGQADSISSGGVATSQGIEAYWQSGYMRLNIDKKAVIHRAIIMHGVQGGSPGSATFTYSYSLDSNVVNTETFSLATTDNNSVKSSTLWLKGRGDTFRFKISLTSSVGFLRINNVLLVGHNLGMKS